jgi:hypothetical protein
MIHWLFWTKKPWVSSSLIQIEDAASTLVHVSNFTLRCSWSLSSNTMAFEKGLGTGTRTCEFDCEVEIAAGADEHAKYKPE